MLSKHSFTLLLLLCIPTEAGLVCFLACYGGIITCGALAAPAILAALGFTSGGVAAGSFAAWWMSQIGPVAAGSLFASLQSIGAGGASFGSAKAAADAICIPICSVSPV